MISTTTPRNASIAHSATSSHVLTKISKVLQNSSPPEARSTPRDYVEETVAEEFKGYFKAAFGAIKAGDPLEAGTDHGPQADEIQFKRVSEYLKLASEGMGKIEWGAMRCR